MTLYLWHIPAIAVAAFVLHAVGLDAFDEHTLWFWGLLALRAVVFTLVMAATFWLLSPLEHRRLPWWDEPVRAVGARASAAGLLVCGAGVALLLVAKNGSAARPGGHRWGVSWWRWWRRGPSRARRPGRARLSVHRRRCRIG